MKKKHILKNPKMKNKKPIFISGYTIYLFSFLLLLAGCRTTRDLTGESAGALKAEEEFFHALCDQSLQFQTLSTRLQFNLEMASGKELSSRGQLKIEKDNRLQISIQPILGIEMFRIELTPDSVKLLDRMNKRYLVEDYAHLKGKSKVDFNFYNLQALFTNQLFLPGETILSGNAYKRYHWEQTTDGYILKTKDKLGLEYLFSADQDEKLYSAKITDMADYTLQWDYTNFKAVENQLFPMKMNGYLSTKNDSKNSITLNYSRIEIDTPLDLKFTIPSGYQRVNFSQVMNMFDSLDQ